LVIERNSSYGDLESCAGDGGGGGDVGGGGRWLALHAGHSLDLLRDARLIANLCAFCPDLMRCPGP
jgi:hypothetical protein